MITYKPNNVLEPTIIRLSKEQKSTLKMLAGLAGVSMAEYVRLLLDGHIQKEFKEVSEDYAR